VALHETGGFNDFKTVSQFTVKTFTRPDGTETSYKANPHFCVNRDGSIIQFLDVCETTEHGQDLSSSGIGIEFVNHPWGADGASQDGMSTADGIAPLQVPTIAGLATLNGKGEKTCVYLASETQLEALVTLLQALFRASALSALRQNWMNVININPQKIATEKLDDLKAYFILNRAKTYLTNVKYAGINANVSSDGWSLKTPGIFDHFLYGSHTDGMILSFYTWLRMNQKMTPADARTTLSAFLESAGSRVDGGSGVSLVDVSPIVFATA
jgi:hypothetical protein